MSLVLPFNQIKIGSSIVAGPDAFAYGSGNYSRKGEDSAVTTADARIHNMRSAQTHDGSCELRGDQTAIDTGYPGTSAPWPVLGGTITLQLVATRGAEGVDVAVINNGIISCEYDTKSGTTKVQIKGTV